MTVRVGILGCGVVSRVHARRLIDHGARITWLCDPDLAAAERLANELGTRPSWTADVAGLLAGVEIDAAVLCSPTGLHYEQARLALAHGVDVLCEKPLAGRREEIEDLIAKARENQRILSVSYQRRYEAPYATARRELAERADWYGGLRSVHVFVCEHWAQTIAGTWRDDAALGAGYFGDAGSHQVDAVFFIAGRCPTRVFAHSDRRGHNVEVVTRVLADLTGGVPLVAHFVGDAHHWREDIHFHCERGDLLLRNCSLFRARDNRVEQVPAGEMVGDDDPDGAFLRAIQQRAPTVSSAECALPMWDWTRAVLESAREQKWVDIESSLTVLDGA